MWNAIKEIGGNLGGFLGKNAGWLGPVAAGIGGFADSAQVKGTGSDIANIVRERERNNYELAKQNHDSYKEYLEAVDRVRAGNMASSQAAAAARAAANRKQDEARLAALSKAQRRYTRGMKESIGTYQPFADVALELLPQQRDVYSNALNQMGMTMAFLNSPEEQAKLKMTENKPIPDHINSVMSKFKGILG